MRLVSDAGVVIQYMHFIVLNVHYIHLAEVMVLEYLLIWLLISETVRIVLFETNRPTNYVMAMSRLCLFHTAEMYTFFFNTYSNLPHMSNSQ